MTLDNNARIVILRGTRIGETAEALLRSLGYRVDVIGDIERWLEKPDKQPVNLVVIDITAYRDDGLELVNRIKNNESTAVIPVLLITHSDETEIRKAAFEAGADDFLTTPLDEVEVQARVAALLKVSAYNRQTLDFDNSIESAVSRRTQELTKAFEKIKIASLDTVFRLSRAAEYKDEDTGAHVERMSHYSSAIARAMNLDEEFIENILWAAPMHDIGKIGIPDDILLKPGKLDDEEWVIMRQHTTIGGEILKDADTDFIRLAQDIALSHHEKWNGKGYPQGLKGEDIPLAGRIVAIADVFDALTSERPYKEPFTMEKALAIIREDTGTHFDPDVAEAFLSIENEITKELNFWKFMSSEPESGDAEADLSDLFSD